MVAVRSAHLNKNEEFELETWVASLTFKTVKPDNKLNASISAVRNATR